MRIVLYTQDMEPITVIDLEKYAVEAIFKRGRVRVPVIAPITMEGVAIIPERPSECGKLTFVDIFAEKVFILGREKEILFTRDEEQALLLKSSFLPGQILSVQKGNRTAFARGFISGLMTATRE